MFKIYRQLCKNKQKCPIIHKEVIKIRKFKKNQQKNYSCKKLALRVSSIFFISGWPVIFYEVPRSGFHSFPSFFLCVLEMWSIYTILMKSTINLILKQNWPTNMSQTILSAFVMLPFITFQMTAPIEAMHQTFCVYSLNICQKSVNLHGDHKKIDWINSVLPMIIHNTIHNT